MFAVDAKPPILEFLRMIRKPSDLGGFAAGAEPPKSELTSYLKNLFPGLASFQAKKKKEKKEKKKFLCTLL